MGLLQARGIAAFAAFGHICWQKGLARSQKISGRSLLRIEFDTSGPGNKYFFNG